MGLALVVDGLRKAYGATRAVDGVDLAVEEGENF
jgi:ABC-type multidrug transport system ATPase subunit